MIDVHVHLDSPVLERKLDELTKTVALLSDLIKTTMEKLMSQYDDIKAAIADEDAEIDQILAFVATGLATISDLQAKLAAAIANQVGPDAAQVLADIQAHTSALKNALPKPAPVPASPDTNVPVPPAPVVDPNAPAADPNAPATDAPRQG